MDDEATWTIHPPDHPDWTYDGPGPIVCDLDPRHPDGGATNVHEVFMRDSPGIDTGAANTDYQGCADYIWDYDFKTYVRIGVFRISNEATWSTYFHIERDAQDKWVARSNHVPAQ